MQSAGYDILKKDDVYLIWVEQVRDLEAARSRIVELTAQSHIEHVAFDRGTRQIVARARPEEVSDSLGRAASSKDEVH